MAPVKQKKRPKARGIGVDFKKVKHKVGRKLAPATNVTKIDVKSKAIILPGQSVAQDKEGLSINSRRQTLKELLTQTAHHSDNVRKDALLGIKDLLARHPKELSLHAVVLVEKLCPRITDKSRSVRHALRDLLQKDIFAKLPQVLMRPLVPIVMAYIFSAMTNLAADIRLSAFGFLDALILSHPLLVTADYVAQIFQSYINFLSKLGIAGQIGSQLPEVLASLLQFLTAVHERSGISKIKAIGDAKEIRESIDTSLSLQNRGVSILALHWYKSVVPEVKSSGRLDARQGGNTNNVGSGQGIKGLPFDLADSLVKALSSCWAECSPLVFSGQSPDKDSMECLIKICGVLHLLLLITDPGLEQQLCADMEAKETLMNMPNSGSSPEDPARWLWIEKCMVPLLHRYCMGSFPFHAPPLNLPRKVEDLLLSLNMGIAEVVLDCIIAGNLPVQEEHPNIARLLDYVEDALNGQMLSSLGLASGCVDKRTIDSHLKLLVSFVPCLMGSINRERQMRLLKAFTNLFQSCKATSKLKHVCLSCIVKILQPPDAKRGRQAGSMALVADIFEFQKQWLQTLPKLLWELKEHSFSSSLAILRVLHYLGQSAPQGSLLAEEYTALQPILIPFFSSLHPSKQNRVRRLHGPFMKLPLVCQQLAIDLLFYYNSFSSAFLKAIAHCLCVDLHPGLIIRCIEVLQAAYCKGSMELTDYLSFLLTVLVEPAPSQGKSSIVANNKAEPAIDKLSCFQRRVVVTGVLCSCFRQAGDRRLVLHLLNSSICNQMVLPLPPLVSYGLIRVVAMLGASGEGVTLPKSLFGLLPTFLANYLVSLAKEKCFEEGAIHSKEALVKPFVFPCLRLLSKSGKLTKAVLHQLCTPPAQENGELLYGCLFALLQVLGIEHVHTEVFSTSKDSSVLRWSTGNEWTHIYTLEQADALSLFMKVSDAAIVAYGFKEDSKQDVTDGKS